MSTANNNLTPECTCPPEWLAQRNMQHRTICPVALANPANRRTSWGAYPPETAKDSIVTPETLDRAEGERRRNAGIATAEDKTGRKQLIDEVRTALAAVALSRDDRTATTDDAHAWLSANKPGEKLGNAMGGVFRCGVWRFIRFRQSARPVAHARPVSVWQYTGGNTQ